jgi:PIN domain nuclease of toxin-antitoxin system
VKYLLDTHTFIWLNGKSSMLSERAAALCSDPANLLLLSLASLWEMQIKLGLGKLTLPAPLAEIIATQQGTNGIRLLPIELPHVLELTSLPDHHKDPFDRMLIAQAIIEKVPLISDDPQIGKYPITVVW